MNSRSSALPRCDHCFGTSSLTAGHKSSYWRRLAGLFSSAAFALAFSVAAWGQATTSLNGTVSDPSGASVTGAKITLTNLDTSSSRQTSVPNIFKNPTQASAGFDYAYPGESGSRNPIRGDGYLATDLNLSKQWRMRYAEGHTLELRWSVFNAFNNTRFDAFTMQDEWDVPSSFGNYNQTLTTARRMEFAGIYRF